MSVSRLRLEAYDDDFLEVSQLFQRTGHGKDFSLQITAIEKVDNYMLLRKFEQKKQEYRSKFGHVRVEKVFHGTKKENIPSILLNNLEVQRHGQNMGCRFGAGVSFSAFSSYSSHYCDKSSTGDQMLLCYVLISNIKEVPEAMRRGEILKEPPFLEDRYPLRYDTTTKDKKALSVVVKFENHTYYPAFVIHFVKVPKFSSTLISPGLNGSQTFVSTIPERVRSFSPPQPPVLNLTGTQRRQAQGSQVSPSKYSTEQTRVLQPAWKPLSIPPLQPSTQVSRGIILSPPPSSISGGNGTNHMGGRSANAMNFSSSISRPNSSSVPRNPALTYISSRPRSHHIEARPMPTPLLNVVRGYSSPHQPTSSRASTIPAPMRRSSTQSSGFMGSLQSFFRSLFCIGKQNTDN